MKKNSRSTSYGLPTIVEYCRSCVMSNQKPNTSVEYKNKDSRRDYIGFDESGICAACRYNKTKENIDWEEREKHLLDLLERHRKNDGSYDVIVPVSGGKDSAFTAHILKYQYGMHPLTVTWAPHIYTDIGRLNLQNMIDHGGLDNILFTPNGKTHRLLTRLAFENMLHPFQPFVLGQKNIGPRTSILYDVPLVMYGESNIEYGDPGGSDDDQMSHEYFSLDETLEETYLGGVSAKELIDRYHLSVNDLEPYLPIDPNRLRKTGTEVRYLGHYLRWDPQECYYYVAENTGFNAASERSEGTYSKYTEIDDKLIPLHFYCMHVKFGIGRAMYDAAQEVRNSKITREEGVALVKKFDGEYPNKWLEEILAYMDITHKTFDDICDKFRPDHLWQEADGHWTLKQPIW